MRKERTENVLAVVLGIGIVAVVIALIVGIIAGVAWFRRGTPIDFPVSETGFPIGVTRLWDREQIRLGMHKDEIGSIVREVSEHQRTLVIISGLIDENERLYGRTGYIRIQFRPNGTANAISIGSNQWAVAGEISVGCSIQNVLDSDWHSYIFHSYEVRHVWIGDGSSLEESMYMLGFIYDESGYIETILLADMLDFVDMIED